MALLIQNIGEFFTGELAQPRLGIWVENGRITALDPEGDREPPIRYWMQQVAL